MFRAILTIIAFIPILWDLSKKITIPWLQAYDSFSYLIDHWTEITKFMSVIKMLKEFEKHLILE